MPGSNDFFLQFIRLAGPYWNSENKAVIRQQTLFLILLTILQIVLAVVITEWNSALFNALENRSMSDLLTQVGFLIIIFLASMAVTMAHLKMKRQLQIGWRNWLTSKVLGQWMTEGKHCQVLHIHTSDHDNPDGRIAEDIRIACDEAIGLCHTLVYSVLILISFTKILWTLSGTVILDLGIFETPIYGYLVWIALLYAFSASLLGWWVGRPLTVHTNALQTAEANFRFGLVKARENSLAIALIHGEANERSHLFGLFQEIKHVYDYQTHAWANILLFNSGYSVISMAFPVLVTAPRFILGSITLGALMQSVQAFQQIASALSWPVNNIAGIAQWRASVERVLGLVKALNELDQESSRPDPQRIQIEKPDQASLELQDLCILKFNGEVVISAFNERINMGDRVLISGDAARAAKLFKAIAGIWPWGHGRIILPDSDPMFFMPPRPYLPDGTLRTSICYPAPDSAFDSTTLENILRLVGMDEFIAQLDQNDSWEKALSREEQQRLGIARLLLNRPKWILLQEALDSLSPQDEIDMMRLICQELPDAGILTYTNQPSVEPFHDRRLHL